MDKIKELAECIKSELDVILADVESGNEHRCYISMSKIKSYQVELRDVIEGLEV